MRTKLRIPRRRRPRSLAGLIAAIAFIALVYLLPRNSQQGNATSEPAPTPTALSAPAAPRPALVAGDVLRVGAWNIEWLGTPASRSGPAQGRLQSSADLADYIEFAKLDVLGVAEVARDEADPNWVSAELRQALELVSRRTGGAWRHRLFPARSGRNQLCGVAWDETRVRIAGEPILICDPARDGPSGAPLWSRPPYGLPLSAGNGLTDVVVVMLHMKSDYRGDFAEHRGEEARLLTEALPQRVSDPDVLLIGDINADAFDEPALRAFTTSGLIDLNAGDQPTHTRYGPLDRVLTPSGQPEFREPRFHIVRDEYLRARNWDEGTFRKRLSDHFMVVCEVAVMPDDD